ncbi:MAG TPA: hypothetical protein VIY86_02550, partial [Pirellulaceae bacterium]
MRFGLVHLDPESEAVARAVRESAEHELLFACRDQTGAPIGSVNDLPGLDGDWNRLLTEYPVDAVIFGSGGAQDLRAEQLRTIAQSGLPLIVTHPVGEAVLGFELQMIQQESESPIVPYFSGIFHPGPAAAASQFMSPDPPGIGRFRQVVATRTAARFTPADEVLVFSRDVMLLAPFLDRIVRLHALRSAAPDSNDWANLGVQMESASGCVVRWSVIPGAPEGLLVSVVGDRMVAEVSLRGTWNDWKWSMGSSDVAQKGHEPEFTTRDDARKALDVLQAAVSHREGRQLAAALWDRACRSVELAETIEWSSRRGKTIELFHESLSEDSTFKGMMAAGGCFALLGALLMIPMIALTELFVPFLADSAGWRRIPWVLLLVLLSAFLALQFLRFWARKPEKP